MKSFYDERYECLIDQLKELRIRSGTTQQDLAKNLGCDQTYISKYEKKQRRLDIIEVIDICNALNTDIVTFLQIFKNEINKGKIDE